MAEQAAILVVDDDREIVGAIAAALEKEGYRVLRAYDGMEALDLAMTKDIHLILIDVMMPKLDGLSAIMKIRERKNLPIIVLSAKSEDSDKVIGLSMGADDYVPKAFSSRELLARIRAVLRRCAPEQESAPPEKTDGRDILRVRDLTVNNHTKEAFLHGEPLNLTVSEFQILFTLISEPGSVFSREDLLRITAERDFNKYDRSIDVHISSLRRKLREDTGSPQYIRTLRGVGYSLIR